MLFGYWFLTRVPFEITSAILYFLVVGILHLVRKKYDGGVPYNYSYSSEFGCLALILFITGTGGRALIEIGNMTGWIGSNSWHLLAATSAMAIGLFWCISTAPKTKGDKVFTLLCVPVLLYFLFITVPVIVIIGGTELQWTEMLGAGLVWLWLYGYDHNTGRLNNPEFHTMHYRE